MVKITKQYTNRESQSLDKYLQEIGKVDLLKSEEEIELAQRIKKGDQRALEKLTKANLRLLSASQSSIRIRDCPSATLLTRGISVSSKRRSGSMKPAGSNSSRMQCGGSGNRSCRRWPNSRALSGFR